MAGFEYDKLFYYFIQPMDHTVSELIFTVLVLIGIEKILLFFSLGLGLNQIKIVA